MFLRYIRNSLRLKLVLASVIVEIIMLTLLLGNSLRVIDSTIEQQSNIRIQSITPLLDSSLSVSLFERDSATLFELLEKLIGVESSEFTYIKVYDYQNRLFADMYSSDSKMLTAESKKFEILDVSAPLTIAGEKIGRVEYGLSIKSLYISKDTLLKQSLLIAAIEIILTILFLGLASYFLTRHIGVLLEAAENISSGDYSTNITVTTHDEIGLLARSFNTMAKAVQDRIAELSATSHALTIKTSEFEFIFNSISDGVIFVDIDRVCVSVNPAMLKMFGYPVEKFVNKKLDFIYLNKNEYYFQNNIRFSKDAPDREDSFEATYVRNDGSFFIGELSASRVRDENGKALGFIGILRDIDERKKNEYELMEAKEKALVTLESIGDAVITTDEKGLVQYLNPVAEELTGWTTSDAQNKPLPKVFDIYNEETNKPIENPVVRCLHENAIIGLANHTVLVNKNNKKFAIEDSAAPIRDKQGNILGVILVFHDVSKARVMAEQLSWQASHDSLTGLINRLEFEVRLKKILSSKNGEDTCHALLYMDLDQFKVVNDTSGHVAGDELLKQLSALLLKHIRDIDTLARLGGDEFGILLENCPLERANEIADSIIKDLEQFRFSWNDKVFTVGISIGLVPFSNNSNDTIITLMSAADVACYAAKDTGSNRIHIYKHDDKELVQRHGEMHWVSQIQLALEEDQFELYCQPIITVNGDHKIVHHHEILIRMKNSESEISDPMSFLPSAERYNLMPDIDRWVISKVVDIMESLSSDEVGMVAINLSGKSLSDDKFLDFVIDKFKNQSINANNFCFEITETAAISNLSHVSAFMSSLKKLGCKFSLDDFGSGLSSFTYLKNLDVDYLKIDGAFVKDMKNDPIDRAMVAAINQIGHIMSIQTIVEFVEDKATMDIVKELGIDYAQGYYFSKPFPFINLRKSTAKI